MHEQLRNYLSPVSGPPTGVPTPEPSPRNPLSRPNGAIPKGKRPIPASSITHRKTNTQIPYARLVLKSAPWEASPGDDLELSDEVLRKPLDRRVPREGDIVFVERGVQFGGPTHAALSRIGTETNSLCRVRTLEDVDRQLKAHASGIGVAYVLPQSMESAGCFGGGAPFAPFPWSLDGVINNVDSEDVENEYKDFTIANVALQGQCRLRFDAAVRGPKEPRATHTLAVVMVGLFVESNGGTFRHRLARFTSAQVARDPKWMDAIAEALGMDPKATFMTAVWTVGKVLDANQSPGMLSVIVGVVQIAHASVKPGSGSLPDYQRYKDSKNVEHTGIVVDERPWEPIKPDEKIEPLKGRPRSIRLVENWSEAALGPQSTDLGGVPPTRTDAWGVVQGSLTVPGDDTKGWSSLARWPAGVVSKRYGSRRYPAASAKRARVDWP